MTTPILRTADQAERVDAEWGDLTWYAGRRLGNADAITVGRCLIRPGRANPLHRHPNCEEVLVVLRGTIRHTVEEGGGTAVLSAGDTVTIPPGFAHRARNVGEEEAVLLVAFSSADRQTEAVGPEPETE